MSAGVARWWPLLTQGAREWLLQHHGEPMPPDVRAEVSAAGGPGAALLADEDVDWIAAVANGEEPDAAPTP